MTVRIEAAAERESAGNAFITLRLFIDDHCVRLRKFRVAALAQRERQRWIEEFTNDLACVELTANALPEVS